MAEISKAAKKVETPFSPLNIYQRINEVRKAVSYIQKDKAVSTGGRGSYKAVTHDKVTAALHDSLVEFGIVIAPSVQRCETVDTGTQTGGGVPIIRFEAVYTIAFVNMDNPDERVSLMVAAHANDQGDKAPGKALSYATKYAMLKMFNLETGEDDEDREEAQAAVITEQQLLDLVAMCDEVGEDQALLDRMAKKVYNVESIKDLPARYYEGAVRRLKKHLGMA